MAKKSGSSVSAPRDNTATRYSRDNSRELDADELDRLRKHNEESRFDDGPLGFVPVVGDLLSGGQVAADISEGDYKDAALGATLLLLPNAIEKTGKAAIRTLADALRQKGYTAAMARELVRSAKDKVSKRAARSSRPVVTEHPLADFPASSSDYSITRQEPYSGYVPTDPSTQETQFVKDVQEAATWGLHRGETRRPQSKEVSLVDKDFIGGGAEAMVYEDRKNPGEVLKMMTKSGSYEAPISPDGYATIDEAVEAGKNFADIRNSRTYNLPYSVEGATSFGDRYYPVLSQKKVNVKDAHVPREQLQDLAEHIGETTATFDLRPKPESVNNIVYENDWFVPFQRQFDDKIRFMGKDVKPGNVGLLPDGTLMGVDLLGEGGFIHIKPLVYKEKLKKLAERINKTSNADFVKRLLDEKRKALKNNDGTVSTHELGYVTEDAGAVVFPNVQSVGDSLVRFPYPQSYERAVERGDTVHMSVPEAEMFTKGYKEVYPGFNKYGEGGPEGDEYSSGGLIRIKPENRGKFTALKESTGHSATWFKEHGTPAQKKMATFALNARHWKHADGGPLDYSGISTTNNRAYNQDYISYIDTAFQNAGMNPVKRASILANIIEESGGDPFAEGPGGFHGLLQWSDERYPRTKEKDVYKELDNQIKAIMSTMDNTTDHMSWTHGGSGSGYNSLKDAYAAFNSDNLEDAMRGYTLGHVRPAGGVDSYNNRLKVAKQIYDRIGGMPSASPNPRDQKIRAMNIRDRLVNSYGSKEKALEAIRKVRGLR